MKEKIVKLYEFEELPEDIQEKVLDRYRDINVDCEWYDYDGKTGFTSKELARMRVKVEDAPDELITFKKMYFDVDRGWFIQFTEAHFSNDEIARKFLRVPANLWAKTHWMFENNRDYTTRLEYEYDYYFGERMNDFTSKQREILERACEIFSDKMEEALKGLRNSYEWLQTDEAVKETILANEYTFTIDGKMEQ